MRWIRRIFQKSHEEGELDKELQFHVERLINDYVKAGVPLEEAQRRARLEFGGMERVKEEVRDIHWETLVDNLVRDFRLAFRNLRKDPRFSLLAILALALGIGSATIIFSAIYGVILNTFPFRDAARVTSFGIVDLAHGEKGGREFLSILEFLDFREQNHSFEDISGEYGGFGSTPVKYKTGDSTYQVSADFMSVNSFGFFGVAPVAGRLVTPDDVKPGAPPVFMMSYKLWHRQFNDDPKMVGQSFTLNGIPRILVGIMPPRFRWGWSEIWIPFPLDRGQIAADKELARQFVWCVGRLKPGVDLKAAANDLDVVAHQLAKVYPKSYPERFTVTTTSLADRVVGGFKQLIYPLAGAVVLLVLIACSNVANLLLTRATVREREIAVRVALGASRGRLVRLFVVESLVLAIAGCLAGCALAAAGIKLMVPFIPYDAFPQEAVIELNRTVLLFALGLTVLTTLLCGIAPALHALRRDVRSQLAGAGKSGGTGFRHGKLRAGLTVAEVGLSMALLVSGGLMMRTFLALRHVELGFNPRRTLFLHLSLPTGIYNSAPQKKELFQRIVQRVQSLPGVNAATVTLALPPFGGGVNSEITIPGKTHSDQWNAMFDLCSEDYFRTLNLRLLRGRLLGEVDVASARRVAVIGQSLARKYFPNDEPIGQTIKFTEMDEISPGTKDAYFEIVGVVSDMRNRGLRDAPIPQAYLPYTIFKPDELAMLVSTAGDADTLIPTIRREIWAVDPNVALVESDTIESYLGRISLDAPKFGLVTLGGFAGIGLLLVAIGIFSVMAYSVSLQTREIGVRMALGAGQGGILKMVLANALRLIGAGVVVGVIGSFALTRLIANQLWGVSAADPWTFGVVVALVGLVGLAACWFPARRAAAVDPLVALRYE